MHAINKALLLGITTYFFYLHKKQEIINDYWKAVFIIISHMYFSSCKLLDVFPLCTVTVQVPKSTYEPFTYCLILFRIDQGHTVKIGVQYWESKLKSNFNCMTMIHIEKSHAIINKTIVYACETIALSTSAIRAVPFMLSEPAVQIS